MALIDKLNAIGEAIRGKTGKTEKLTLAQMPDEITAIQVGGGGDKYADLAKAILNKSVVEVKEGDMDEIGVGGSTNTFYLFYSAKNLKNFSSSTFYVNTSAFHECSALETVTVGSVGSWATNGFCNCASLKKVKVAKNSGFVGNATLFNGCGNLEVLDITAFTAPQSLSAGILDNFKAKGKIVVADNLVDTFKSNTNWAAYGDIIIGKTDAKNAGLIE